MTQQGGAGYCLYQIKTGLPAMNQENNRGMSQPLWHLIGQIKKSCQRRIALFLYGVRGGDLVLPVLGRDKMAPTKTPQQCGQIAILNDEAREMMGYLCRIHESAGFLALTSADRERIRKLVWTYDDWDDSGNAFAEHEFGAVYQLLDGRWTTDHKGLPWQCAVYWKFEYSDLSLTAVSSAPWDESVTTRILTFMLAEEYGPLTAP